MHNLGTVWPTSQGQHIFWTQGETFWLSGKSEGHNAEAICCVTLIEPVCLCACSWRVTRLCVQCVMVWHCHYGWVVTAGGMATDRGLVLVVLTLAGHNNLLLVKQVSSWQNHYCLHMVMRTGEGLGNRFRGQPWASPCLKWGGGDREVGRGTLGLFSCISEHWRVVLNCHNTN